MPFVGDFSKWKKLARNIEALGKTGGKPQASIARAVINELRRGPIAEQYRTGIGPDGPWQERRDGKPALVSRKLARVIRGEPVNGGARFTWRSSIMLAHHEGHVFPARTGGGHSVFFDENNRAFRLGKLNRRGLRATFVREVRVGSHMVGARILPSRRQYPRPGSMPIPWAQAIARGARSSMGRWYANATR